MLHHLPICSNGPWSLHGQQGKKIKITEAPEATKKKKIVVEMNAVKLNLGLPLTAAIALFNLVIKCNVFQYSHGNNKQFGTCPI